MGEEYTREVTVLGSVPHLGPVLVYDDIEYLFKWTKANGVGDSVCEKSATLAYNGDSCLHVKTRVTSAAEEDVCLGYRLLFQRPGQRYRMECLFMPDAAASAKEIIFWITLDDGATVHHIRVKWDAANTKWIYQDTGGGYADFAGGSQNLNANQYHRFLVEWDENSHKITRFVCNGLELRDLSLDYYTAANVAAVSMRLDLGLTAGASPPGEIYFDDVLVMEI